MKIAGIASIVAVEGIQNGRMLMRIGWDFGEEGEGVGDQRSERTVESAKGNDWDARVPKVPVAEVVVMTAGAVDIADACRWAASVGEEDEPDRRKRKMKASQLRWPTMMKALNPPSS